MAAELDPMELLRGELAEDEASGKVSALGRLRLVAAGLHPARARQELVPFLDSFARESGVDEDLAALAAGMAGVAAHLGGDEHVHLLLPTLEFLCAAEETFVRAAAVKTLSGTVIPHLIDRDVLAKVFPMVKRLAAGDWWPSRHSATGLFTALYPRAPPDAGSELRAVFVQLINDDVPIVRRAAFDALAEFATLLTSDALRADFVPILQALARDDSDSTRKFAASCSAGFCVPLTDEERAEHVLPVVEALQDDPSWRVREQLCAALPLLCERNGPAGRDRLLPVYVKFLQDAEPNIRLDAVRQMEAVGNSCGDQIARHVGPVLDAVADDQYEPVRVSLSETVVHLSRAVGRETAQEVVLPLCQRLAKDELPDVRHNILTQIEELVEVLGPDTAVDAVLPTVLALAADPKWRVRSEVIHKVCVLSERLGVQVFEQKLQPVVINGLSDHVYAIRDMAARQVCELVRFFGAAWAAEKLFPQALAVFDSSTNYLHRMTSLTIVANVAQHLDAATAEKYLLGTVEAACKDEVANVRLAAAKAAAEVARRLDPSLVNDRLRPLVESLRTDADSDVSYAAERACESMSSTSSSSAA